VLIIGDDDNFCAVYPEIGGSIGRWTVGGQDMLRAAKTNASAIRDPLAMATFPLVPYSNRIANGQFAWDGKTIMLTKNFAPEPHAIHGVGWNRDWSVTRQERDSVLLTFDHPGDDGWPWPFTAKQHVSVGGQTLTLALDVTNNAEQAVPLSFGHHPYFDAEGAMLAFPADAVWMAADDFLPTEPRVPKGQFDFRDSAPVEGRSIDHCYGGVSGPANISWRDRPLALEITSTPQLAAAVVYVPAEGDSFCFEPVAHISNALNLPGQKPEMPIVAPGAAFQTVITFRAFGL
jgi:aldose 1-epimerase